MKKCRDVEACKRWLVVCAEHKNKRHYVPRRKPACAKVSEEKRRTVWAEGEFSPFSERAHPAGRLGAFSLDLLLHTFLVSRQEKYVGLGKAQEKILCFAQITCKRWIKKGRNTQDSPLHFYFLIFHLNALAFYHLGYCAVGSDGVDTCGQVRYFYAVGIGGVGYFDAVDIVHTYGASGSREV